MSRLIAQVTDLSVRYSDKGSLSVLALDTVSLSVWPGEVLAIVGESGSGKSTLAAALLRSLPSTARCTGSIRFDGKDLLGMHPRDLRHLRGARLSLIPQDPASALNPVLRIGPQISEVLRAHLRMSSAERQFRIRELLSEVGFNDPERIVVSYPHELSGGQRQRVVIAQAIACRPVLIIADESTSKLDGPLQAETMSLLADVVSRYGTALIWITHELATVAGFASRIAVMHGGRVVEEGRTQELLRRPTHTYTRQLVRFARERTLTLRVAAGQSV